MSARLPSQSFDAEDARRAALRIEARRVLRIIRGHLDAIRARHSEGER